MLYGYGSKVARLILVLACCSQWLLADRFAAIDDFSSDVDFSSVMVAAEAASAGPMLSDELFSTSITDTSLRASEAAVHVPEPPVRDTLAVGQPTLADLQLAEDEEEGEADPLAVEVVLDEPEDSMPEATVLAMSTSGDPLAEAAALDAMAAPAPSAEELMVAQPQDNKAKDLGLGLGLSLGIVAAGTFLEETIRRAFFGSTPADETASLVSTLGGGGDGAEPAYRAAPVGVASDIGRDFFSPGLFGGGGLGGGGGLMPAAFGGSRLGGLSPPGSPFRGFPQGFSARRPRY